MNITVFANTSSLLSSDLFIYISLMPSLISLILRLPVNIYILNLIMSRHLITSELYALNGSIFEVICLYDFLGAIVCVFPNKYLRTIKQFFLGFIVTGRPCLLALICVERYLAVVKPVAYLRLKPLKYKLTLFGIVWFLTLVSCTSNLIYQEYEVLIAWQLAACCLVNLYCCTATLFTLKKPGPGEGLRQREGMGNIKLKAFRIILIITVSVFLMYVPLMLVILFKDYFTPPQFLGTLNVCYICTSVSGFVQPLLFLKRSGKLPFIKWP